jgi:hypothetical protein
MKFKVDYFDAAGPTGSDANVPSMAEAKALVARAVQSGMAVRAEVRNADGTIFYHLPRITRRAQ